MYPLEKIRGSFPSLSRKIDGREAVYFDGPGGSQVPQSVADTVSNYLLNHNANTGMSFATSIETDEIITETLSACAEFLGCSDPNEIAFGQNMTSLNIQLASALSKTWGPGDEVVVTRLDHDGNVRPWSLAAEWSGASLKKIEVNPDNSFDYTSNLRDIINLRANIIKVKPNSLPKDGVVIDDKR